MIEKIQIQTDPRTAATELMLLKLVSDKLYIDPNRIKKIVVTGRSIDARQRAVKVNLRLTLYIDEIPQKSSLLVPETYEILSEKSPKVVIVGAGPAGLFAALRLIQLGIRPVILERGKDVDTRRKDLAQISREGKVDADSNYCFGEGGAGAYSDGKLFTRSKKRGNTDRILNILCQHGAKEDILIESHPHIGTDRLPEIIKNIRKTIEHCGGEVRFQTKVTDLLIKNDRAIGVHTDKGDYYGPVILATGHSARDTYSMLHNVGVKLIPKGIAVGVRLEHPQVLIDRIRYHSKEGRGKYLPPAEYTFLTRVDGRAVYSFCMCPGGIVVPSASSPGEIVVNGMSPSNRGSRWANSAMVVEVLPEDISLGNENPLKMMDFQAKIESDFFCNGDGSQNAPAQLMTDFVKGQKSETLPPTSYAPGVHSERVDKLLPDFISYRLKKGFQDFDRKNRGFLTDKALVIGNETRTSSPVRIERDSVSLQSVTLPGVFPCGEGAGYAGGIVSAAMDGENVADAVAQYLKRQ